MKKIYTSPEVALIEFDVEEALLASVIEGSGAPGTEIGDGEVPLW